MSFEYAYTFFVIIQKYLPFFLLDKYYKSLPLSVYKLKLFKIEKMGGGK